MHDKKLLEYFYNRYTTKEETMYRLSVNADIETFWAEELKYRKKRAEMLPLHSADGEQYMYNKTAKYVEAADYITSMAREFDVDRISSEFIRSNVIDEAYYSSTIEGAFSTRERAKYLIESGENPKDKDEQMVLNNYKALVFALDNLDSNFSHELILKIGELLTENTMEDNVEPGYRDDDVFVVSKTGQTIYTAPKSSYVKSMMDELIDYLNQPMIHPVEKAVIAHIFFVTVHPFFDGNGRTARAITYMVLLKSGYDFFKYVPISGILSEQRGKYYKAIRACQDKANGCDLTYFAEYYTSVLSETINSVKRHQNVASYIKNLKEQLDIDDESRLIKGLYWLIAENIKNVTSDKWKNKFGVSFETARSDLNTLEEVGFVRRRLNGRKVIYDVSNELLD